MNSSQQTVGYEYYQDIGPESGTRRRGSIGEASSTRRRRSKERAEREALGYEEAVPDSNQPRTGIGVTKFCRRAIVAAMWMLAFAPCVVAEDPGAAQINKQARLDFIKTLLSTFEVRDIRIEQNDEYNPRTYIYVIAVTRR